MWKDFWNRILSPQTARFVLALLALFAAVFATFWLMGRGIAAEAEDAVIFALGFLFSFVKDAFGYYFGSTARGDENPQDVHVTNTPTDAVPTTDEEK